MIKISKKLIASFLSYSIFLRGLFFYAAPCSRPQLDVRNLSLGRGHLVNVYEVKAGICEIAG